MLTSPEWQHSPVGEVLIAAQGTQVAQVWAGPTNVIETIQTTETARRKVLSSMILDLIEAKRMWWGHEFEAIEEFFLFLTMFAPDAIRHREYFEHHGDVARQTWLGALALAAATDGSHLGPIVEVLRHTKAVNQLMHARFALAPDEWVDQMISAAQQLKTTSTDPLADLDAMSLAEITTEIDRLAANARRIDKRTSARLDKSRNVIAQAYGGIEIGALLQAVFTLPFEIELTFNIPHIVTRWSEIQRATGCEALPKEVREADEVRLIGDTSIARLVIGHAIRAAARRGLMTTMLGIQVIIREMQRCMNADRVPTGGLAFDADHAAALVQHEVFVTHDEWLAMSLKAMAKQVRDHTEGQWCPEVVTTAKQLEHVLSRPMGKS